MTARREQHDFIQYLKSPKVREPHFIENQPDDIVREEQSDVEEAQEGGLASENL